MTEQQSDSLTILAIETSCDETAAAVVRGGQIVLANVVASQIEELRRYGGVVPEVASRQHILALEPVINEALQALPGGWNDVDAIAATNGPGLSGALLTGLNAAKAIAFARSLPFIGVNHIEAHIYANWLESDGAFERSSVRAKNTSEEMQTAPTFQRPNVPTFPIVALVVSGGHTLLALLEGHGRYRVLGQTRDDAAGEAFDKTARIMGLDFPGGPAIQRAAENAPGGVTLPRAWLRDSYDFSFSGLKTAVLHQVQARNDREAKVGVVATKNLPRSATNDERRPTNDQKAQNAERKARDEANNRQRTTNNGQQTTDKFTTQLAHAFQESVVDVLVTKTVNAAQAFGATEILLAGGVAANTRLRAEMQRRAPIPVRYPPIELCTDNAAMVAAAAFYRYASGVQSGWDLDVNPNLRLT